MTDSVAQRLGELLKARGQWVATAESCTGGLIGDRITDISGSSAWFRGGAIVYHNDAKQRLLGVSQVTLQQQGAVSEAVAIEMAAGARRLFDADYALSATGIAGPDGGSLDKPVGLVYIGLALREGVWARRHIWEGDRRANKAQTADAALTWLLDHLTQSALPTALVTPGRSVPKHNVLREPTEVEAIFAPSGKVRVLRFTWQGRAWPVVSQGRQRDTGGELRTLVMTTRDRVYELLFERSTEKWFITLASEERLAA
ncbi:MAG TPA: CinA family protein [Anaerolineales bacterium]|nr:CinA family protein [Anaerolineales bacterium]HRF50125.1 CinA family protein [Anaerolineales bacterium]